MSQERFHRGVEYVLYRQGEADGRAWMEFRLRHSHATVARYHDDDVLEFYLKHGTQQNFLRVDVYEIEGPGKVRTKVKYVDRVFDGNRILLIFRRLRRRVLATA